MSSFWHLVQQSLQQESLTLNEKCEFTRDTVLFRGYKITTTGIEPGPAKVNVIKEMPEPQNVADIRQVLGYGWLFSKAPSQSCLTPYTMGSAPL